MKAHVALLAHVCLQPPPSHDALQFDPPAQICTHDPDGHVHVQFWPLPQLDIPPVVACFATAFPVAACSADPEGGGVGAAADSAALPSAGLSSVARPHVQPAKSERTTTTNVREITAW